MLLPRRMYLGDLTRGPAFPEDILSCLESRLLPTAGACSDVDSGMHGNIRNAFFVQRSLLNTLVPTTSDILTFNRTRTSALSTRNLLSSKYEGPSAGAERRWPTCLSRWDDSTWHPA
ncbi:hypothetical protein PMIN02_012545 [Paraphaeosphaeria minitans]